MIKNVLLVDDDHEMLIALKEGFQRFKDSFSILLASDGLKAVESLKKNTISLVVTDLKMPGMDGFELLDALKDITFDLIFITAFNNYATKAFRYYAVDYLLKPIIAEELIESVGRAEQKNDFKYNKNDLQKIFQAIDQQDVDFKNLAVPTREGVEFIQLDNILRLEADGNYTYIFLKNNQKIYTSKTLKIFEKTLPTSKFYRPHQSHIVCIESMARFVKTDGGYIVMSDGTQVSLARSKRQEFSERFY